MKKFKKLLTKRNIIIAAIACIAVATVAILISINTSHEDAKETIEETYYSVTFETDGGEEIEPQSILSESLVTKPTDPKKEGHTFVGWYSDKELTVEFDFSKPVDKDLILYAKWNSEVKIDDNKEQKQQNSTQKSSATTSKTQSKKTGGSSSTPSSSQGKTDPTPKPEPTPTPTPTPKPVYKIIATPVDPYSPDVKLSVTKDGVPVSFSSIKSNGQEICKGSSPYVSRNELSSSSFSVVLSTGEVVTATL